MMIVIINRRPYAVHEIWSDRLNGLSHDPRNGNIRKANGLKRGASNARSGGWHSNKRAGFILATKGGGKMGPAAWDVGSSRKHLLDAIDASLRRLNTDYVDLYQLHMDDPVTPIDEMVGAMDTILRSGRGRCIGASNFLAYRLAKALGRQDTLKLTRFVSAQPRYNLLFREVER